MYVPNSRSNLHTVEEDSVRSELFGRGRPLCVFNTVEVQNSEKETEEKIEPERFLKLVFLKLKLIFTTQVLSPAFKSLTVTWFPHQVSYLKEL